MTPKIGLFKGRKGHPHDLCFVQEDHQMSQRNLLPRHPTQIGDITVPTSSSREEEQRDPSPTPSVGARKRGPLVTAACNACRKRKVKVKSNFERFQKFRD